MVSGIAREHASDCRIRLVLGGEPGVFRSLVATRITTTPAFELIGSLNLAESMVGKSRRLAADVALLLLGCNQGSHQGLEIACRLSREVPVTRVLTLAQDYLPWYASKMSRCGIAGVLVESQGWATISGVIIAVHNGAVISPSSTADSWRSGDVALTEDETSLMQLVCRGLSNREIAGELFISASAVRSRLSSILERLGATNRTQAATESIRRGLVTL